MKAHRLITTAVSMAAVSTAALVGIAPAQAEMAHRSDTGESAGSTSVKSGPLAAAIEGDNIRVSSLSSTERTTRASGSDAEVWSFADDGTLELRATGAICRHGNYLLF
jgi:hypothetical protein